jgi:hypothetical protein
LAQGLQSNARHATLDLRAAPHPVKPDLGGDLTFLRKGFHFVDSPVQIAVIHPALGPSQDGVGVIASQLIRPPHSEKGAERVGRPGEHAGAIGRRVGGERGLTRHFRKLRHQHGAGRSAALGQRAKGRQIPCIRQRPRQQIQFIDKGAAGFRGLRQTSRGEGGGGGGGQSAMVGGDAGAGVGEGLEAGASTEGACCTGVVSATCEAGGKMREP